MTIRKINGSTFSVDGIKVTVKKNNVLVIDGNSGTASYHFSRLSKPLSRKIRKALFQLGYRGLAGAPTLKVA